MPDGDKEHEWAQGVIRLTRSDLAFCSHEHWSKFLASIGPSGGSPIAEAGPAVSVPQVLPDGYNHSGDSPIPWSLL